MFIILLFTWDFPRNFILSCLLFIGMNYFLSWGSIMNIMKVTIREHCSWLVRRWAKNFCCNTWQNSYQNERFNFDAGFLLIVKLFLLKTHFPSNRDPYQIFIGKIIVKRRSVLLFTCIMIGELMTIHNLRCFKPVLEMGFRDQVLCLMKAVFCCSMSDPIISHML